MRLPLLLLCLLSLSACSTYSLQNLRQTTPKGTPFQTVLAMKYLEFADGEEQQYDWSSSWHFADKGLAAAYGNDVDPEYVESWSVPEETRAELFDARDALMLALTPEAKEQNPQAAAEAVFFFDCWLEQQQENWQGDDIAYCRENFESALLALQQQPQAEAAPEPAPLPEPERTSYLVFFGLGRAELDDSARRTVDKIAEDLTASNGDYDIILNGHTDRVGAAKSNMQLSRHRAERVKAALTAHGVPASRIKSYGFGETDPRKQTKDDVREPANRRVEIFVN